MPDLIDDLFLKQKPTSDRPLQGQTVLIVEDSRFASEAVRLLCLRSGARVRRADSLASATRHLATYRPSVVIIDLGLPDGSGISLIEELASAEPSIPVILASSGDDSLREQCIRAGAKGFLTKPINNLAAFQDAILSRLPPEERPNGPRSVPNTVITPDKLAFDDDLSEVAEALSRKPAAEDVAYLAQFIDSIARAADDRALSEAASLLRPSRNHSSDSSTLARAAGIVRSRVGARRVV